MKQNKIISVYDAEPHNSDVFVDNLTISSAERLLNCNYDFLNQSLCEHLKSKEIKNLVISHDILNLSSLIESIISFENIYTNSESINRWSTPEKSTALGLLEPITTLIYCPKELRTEIEQNIAKISIVKPMSFVKTVEHILYRNCGSGSPTIVPLSNSFEEDFIQPYDEGHPYTTPYWIKIGTAFYLACSQFLNVPYKPSTMRAQMLNNEFHHKFHSNHISAQKIFNDILNKSREDFATKIYNKVLEFNFIENYIPSLLAAVLKESNNPEDLLKVAFQIRDSSGGRAFRNWCSEFNLEIQNGDLSKLGNFSRDLKIIISSLHKELGLEDDNKVQLKIGWAPINLTFNIQTPHLIKRKFIGKRHLMFLSNTYRNMLSVMRLSDELKLVFRDTIVEQTLNNQGELFNWDINRSFDELENMYYRN